MDSSTKELVTVYYDTLCPYAKRGMELADWLKEDLALEFEWKHYSLRQGNYQGSDWQLWDDPLDEEAEDTSGLLSFLACDAARKQSDPFGNFRLKLMQARHDTGESITLTKLRDLAGSSGLDVAQFSEDIYAEPARERLAAEHQEAVARHISATPTFCFASGAAAYFRFTALPAERGEALAFFQAFRTMIERYPQLQTIRRPYSRKR